MRLMERLYVWTKEEAVKDILAKYRWSWYCIVSFVYFSDIMRNRLLEKKETEIQKKYEQALQWADFILPDGIALQLFYRRWPVGRASSIRLKNLNGTDFIPYLMEQIVATGESIHVWLYDLYDEKIWKSREHIEVAKQKFSERFGIGIDYTFQVHYAKRKIAEFDFDAYQKSLDASPATYRILWMSVWTPEKEIWAEQHRTFLEKNKILLINAWGTLDYISGFEQRAPKWVVKARILETCRRVLQNPNKNFKKLVPMFWILRYWRRSWLGTKQCD